MNITLTPPLKFGEILRAYVIQGGTDASRSSFCSSMHRYFDEAAVTNRLSPDKEKIGILVHTENEGDKVTFADIEQKAGTNRLGTHLGDIRKKNCGVIDLSG